ncbi:MAG: MinD/ParA family protein, partial [Actinobacteria bacterium]|nr:MinD/ParA family protein [Actinomycetota bacterium]
MTDHFEPQPGPPDSAFAGHPVDTPPAWPRVNPAGPNNAGMQHTEPLQRRPGYPPQAGPTQPGPAPYQPWPHGPQGQFAAPVSYADAIRRDDLLRPRKPEPSRGWRKALFKATFGLVNLGPSPDEIQEAQQINRIRSALSGHYKVGVMGKGGVGKTTVSASLESLFAELRQEDRVVAVDADTAFGKLGSRVDPKALSSYWELASDQHLESFADIRNRVGSNAAGLFVLAGEASPARRRVLDPAVYR